MTRPEMGFGPEIDLHVQIDTGRAVFGRGVLAGLVSVLQDATRRPRTERSWGPCVLGCTMWMDDPELLAVIGQMANACVVVTKQPRSKYNQESGKQLRALASNNGLMQSAYRELSELVPTDQPRLVGPYWSGPDTAEIGAVREVGYRKVDNHLVPIVHAKMLLLGQMGWTDEDPVGGVADYSYFIPECVWIGSANFTKSSRKSLEMGMWTSDPSLLAAARTWLLTLISISEPFGASADDPSPELLPVEYDEAAMIDAMHELWDDSDDDGR